MSLIYFYNLLYICLHSLHLVVLVRNSAPHYLRLTHFLLTCSSPSIPLQEHLEMPSWMAALHKSFNDGRTHKNIRLFITRLIVNRSKVFQPYARFWLVPLTQLVISGDSGGVGLHYFVVDVMVTILSWSTTAVLEVIIILYLISQLFGKG